MPGQGWAGPGLEETTPHAGGQARSLSGGPRAPRHDAGTNPEGFPHGGGQLFGDAGGDSRKPSGPRGLFEGAQVCGNLAARGKLRRTEQQLGMRPIVVAQSNRGIERFIEKYLHLYVAVSIIFY